MKEYSSGGTCYICNEMPDLILLVPHLYIESKVISQVLNPAYADKTTAFLLAAMTHYFKEHNRAPCQSVHLLVNTSDIKENCYSETEMRMACEHIAALSLEGGRVWRMWVWKPRRVWKMWVWKPRVDDSVEQPRINGEWQTVSKEEISEVINQWKDKINKRKGGE